jgi:AraC-like DNA-binding protein
MKPRATVMIDRGVRVLLRALGLDPQRVLARGGLPGDLFEPESIRLSVPAYFSLVEAIDAEANDPALALRMASVASPELFSPPVFAVLCSANLMAAVMRLAAHKRLVAPVQVLSQESARGFEVSWAWDDLALRPPRLLAEFELAFLVQLARIGTREHLVPVRVVCPHPLGSPHFSAYFGVEPETGDRPALVFSLQDALRSFVTASESLWRSFQPELQRLRAETEAHSAASDRVRVAIQECLPCGEVTIDAVARRLRMGRRTLQRRLSDDGVTFRDLVREVREALASHYVGATALPFAEVSFLLGFDEPSSFFRAFREWTGATPQAVRTTRRAGFLSATLDQSPGR